MALRNLVRSAGKALVLASAASEVGKLSARLENLHERLQRARDKRALLDLEGGELALSAAEGGETASRAMQAHHAEDAALVQDIRTLELATDDVKRQLTKAEERQRMDGLKAANHEIKSLLKERHRRLRDMELAADSFAYCLDELDRIGKGIRQARTAHLAPGAASDELTTTALYVRIRRYLGRKFSRYQGLGFEKMNDGTEPAPWTDWERHWERDLLIPNPQAETGRSPYEKRQVA